MVEVKVKLGLGVGQEGWIRVGGENGGISWVVKGDGAGVEGLQMGWDGGWR